MTDDHGPDIGVRPYFVTGGRTRTARPLGVEALVETTDAGRTAHRDGATRLRFEAAGLVAACDEGPVSVAELASRLDVALGVARVLVSDLADDGLVVVHDGPTSPHDDIPLLQRLIHGVRAL